MVMRRIFWSKEIQFSDCMELEDHKTGVRGRPNTTCTDKIREGPYAEYHMNACGYRSAVCGAKAAGAYRIVLLGSSYTMGSRISYEKSYAARLTKELNRSLGRPVEVDNRGIVWGTPKSLYLRMDDALNAQPDMILWTMTPLDVEAADSTNPDHSFDPPAETKRLSLLAHVLAVARKRSPIQMAKNQWDRTSHDLSDTASIYMLRDKISQSRYQFLRSALYREKTGFLEKNQSPHWEHGWHEFNHYCGEIAKAARAAGIPLVITVLPDRAYAAVLSAGKWPDDLDPYLFARRVKATAKSHGAVYIDILPEFASLPAAESCYYPVDTHLNERGSALVGHWIAERIQPLISARADVTHSVGLSQANP